MATRTVDLGPVVGPQGPAGPNEITSATETDLTGFLYGDGSNVGVRAISNRNLLDNPWFRVNQRGASSYSADGYTVDRWRFGLWQTTSPSVQLLSDGVRISGSASGSCTCRIVQIIDSPEWMSGKTFTISCLIKEKVASKAPRLLFTTNAGYASVNITGTGLFSATVTLGSGVTTASVWLGQDGSSAGSGDTDFTVTAIKLELGTISTLANDAPPNYAEELLKCQRYFYRYNGLTTASAFSGSNVTACTIPFPVTMLGVPAISNITYYDSKVADGQGAYVSGVRFYNSNSVSFSVTGFDASADI